jgi:hypothetical protein
MKAQCAGLAVLFLVACGGSAQTAQESRLNVAQFGLVKTSCVWYPGQVRFLDDNHLAISAPVAYSCDKGNRGKATDTQITVIDLQGHQLAGTRRANVVEMVAGPTGYVTVCTGDRIELLSRDLQIVASIEIGAKGAKERPVTAISAEGFRPRARQWWSQDPVIHSSAFTKVHQKSQSQSYGLQKGNPSQPLRKMDFWSAKRRVPNARSSVQRAQCAVSRTT